MTVEEVVKHNLSYLTSGDDATITLFEYDAMVLCQACFKKLDSELGQEFESLYTPLQLSLLADLVTLKMLIKKVVDNSTTSTAQGGSLGTYLKRAKAGSTEAEFDMPNVNNSAAVGLKTNDLLAYYKKEALLKAGMLGCNLAAFLSDLLPDNTPWPYIVVPYTHCGC